MKTTATVSMILAAFAFAGAALAADDHWTYDPSANTISDGEWTFNATVSGTSMTVGSVVDEEGIGYPSAVSTLDFSKPVRDASYTAYTIVTLNTQFSTSGSDKYENATAKNDGASRIGKLILPETGLASIGAGAFGCCSALTNVVNFLPDSVTSVGIGAFVKSASIKGDLRLIGLVGNISKSAFSACTGIKSVEFGPSFKGTDGGNKTAPFQGCSGLTNVVFSPESSGIALANNAFNANATYSQPLVLYGVVSMGRVVFGSVKVSSITFDNGIRSMNMETDYASFAKNSSLREVHFLGKPPSMQSVKWADYVPGTDNTVTTYIYRRFNKTGEWSAYAADGQIDMHDSTFSSEWATEPLKRPLLYIDKMAGYYISFK